MCRAPGRPSGSAGCRAWCSRRIDSWRSLAGTEALWDALSPDSPETTAAVGASGDLGPCEALLVWRQEIAVYHRALAPDERVALATIANGSCFGVICERLAAVHGDDAAAARAFAWLSTWLTDGLLVRLDG